MPRPSKLDPFHNTIGTVPDREISRAAGVSIATVCHYRQKWNIPSYRSTLAPAARRPADQPPRIRRVHGFTATVLVDGDRVAGVVIAADIHAAIAKAQTRGEVLDIRLAGPAIVSQ